MESDIDRSMRRTFPQNWPRFTIWTAAAFGANYLHSLVFTRILRQLPGDILPEIYARVAASAILTFTLAGLCGLVACYFYDLRDRRIHTAMTELGLAIRAVVAGVIALIAFVGAIWLFQSGTMNGREHS